MTSMVFQKKLVIPFTSYSFVHSGLDFSVNVLMSHILNRIGIQRPGLPPMDTAILHERMPGIMKAALYVDILEKTLLPFVREVFAGQ